MKETEIKKNDSSNISLTEQIERLKETGNKLFKNKQYKEALKIYSEGLALNPSNHILYSNRGLTYFYLHDFNNALKDAEQSILLDPKWTKGYYLKGKCHFQKREWKLARRNFSKALDLSPNSKDILNEFQEAEKNYLREYYFPFTKGFRIEVKQNSLTGSKGVYSTEGFQFGDKIFTEIPLVSHRFVEDLSIKISSAHFQDTSNRSKEACSYCLRSFVNEHELSEKFQGFYNQMYPTPPSFIYCDQCKIEPYCSIQCRDIAWKKYHRVLCWTFNSQAEHPLLTLYMLAKQYGRTNLLLIARIFGMVIQYALENEPERAFEAFETFMTNPEPSLGDEQGCKLVLQAIQLWKLQEIEKNNHSNLSWVEKLKNFDESKLITLSNWQLFQGMILRNVQCIRPVSDFSVFVETASNDLQKLIFASNSISSFDQFIQTYQQMLESLTICGGSGLFTLANSMNHSCNPNVVIMSPFPNYQIQVVAIQDISPGDELTFSYIDETQPFEVRQKILLEKYLFKCNCSKCQAKI